jgi:hypothetical protein
MDNQPIQSLNNIMDLNTNYEFFIKTESEQTTDNMNQRVYLPITTIPNEKQLNLDEQQQSNSLTIKQQQSTKMRTIKELTAIQETSVSTSQHMNTSAKTRPISSMPTLITSLDGLSKGILSK